MAALLVWAASAAAAATGERYLAVFADGRRLEGDKLSGWHEHPGNVQLDDTALLEGASPLRWLLDRTLPAYDEAANPVDHIEFVGGDRLIGRVVGAEPAPPDGGDPQRRMLLVSLFGSADLPSRLRRDRVTVLDASIRRVVWGRQPRRPYQPSTLLLRNGGQICFLQMRWTDEGVRLLQEGGVRQVPFSEIAELNLPPTDPWEAYCRELAVLSPNRSSHLIRLETASGLILTTSTERFRATAVGDAKTPEHWYHLVQPAWSADPICVPFQTIRMRWHFGSHEMPLAQLEPVKSVQRPLTGWDWPWQRNRNVRGGLLIVGGEPAGWGFGVHAHNELTFELPPPAVSFRTRVGLDHVVGRGGCTRALIHLDTIQAKPIYRSRVLVGSATAADTGELNVASGGEQARRLILVADAAHEDRPPGADPLDIRDTLDWADPMVRLSPARLQADLAGHMDAAVPAWRGWTAAVGGAAAWPIQSRWDTTDQKYPHFVSVVATGGKPLVLSRTARILDRHQWLRLCVRERPPSATKGFSEEFTTAAAWKPIGPGHPTLAVQDGIGRLVPADADRDWGAVETDVCVDVDRYAFLSVKVNRAAGRWAVKVNDGAGDRGLMRDSDQTGVFAFDLRKHTVWQGVQAFKIRLCYAGRNQPVEFDWVRLSDKPAGPLQPALGEAIEPAGQPGTWARVEVRIDGRPLARLPVQPPGTDEPYLVGLPARRGKEATLQVIYTPGSPAEQTDWPALSLIDRTTRVNWVPLRIVQALSQNGTVLTVQPDGSVLAGGENRIVERGVDTYVVRATTDLPRITAIRIEALADSSLAGGGPGRNGNFMLSQLRLWTLALERKTIRGRYVRVELPRPKQVLSLAEVQVFRPPPAEATLLEMLQRPQPPLHLTRPEHRTAEIAAILKTPAPGRDLAQRCLLRSYLDAISENVAPKGRARQSSTAGQFKAELAIDGEVGGTFTYTNEEDQPWWELDLGGGRLTAGARAVRRSTASSSGTGSTSAWCRASATSTSAYWTRTATWSGSVRASRTRPCRPWS